jgi:hypothetical protein
MEYGIRHNYEHGTIVTNACVVGCGHSNVFVFLRNDECKIFSWVTKGKNINYRAGPNKSLGNAALDHGWEPKEIWGTM